MKHERQAAGDLLRTGRKRATDEAGLHTFGCDQRTLQAMARDMRKVANNKAGVCASKGDRNISGAAISREPSPAHDRDGHQ